MNTANNSAITSEEIEKCIAILSQLVANTDEIFHIEKAQRTELIKVAGMFSRPNRDEFSRRKKDGKKWRNANWQPKRKM